jgi:hypothetical protein
MNARCSLDDRRLVFSKQIAHRVLILMRRLAGSKCDQKQIRWDPGSCAINLIFMRWESLSWQDTQNQDTVPFILGSLSQYSISWMIQSLLLNLLEPSIRDPGPKLAGIDS